MNVLTRLQRQELLFAIRVGCAATIVACAFAIGFGGFWLADDFPIIASLYGAEQNGHLAADMAKYLTGGLSSAGSFYRPLVMPSFAVNYLIGGLAFPVWYGVNLSVHLCNVVLIAYVVRRLAALSDGNASWSAPLAGLMFGISPMLAEGVFWPAARADGWVTLLSLLAVRAWIASPGKAWLLPALMVAALGFKESAAVLPLQVTLLLLAIPGCWDRERLTALTVAFVLVIAFMGLRIHLFGHAWGVYAAPNSPSSLPTWSTFVSAVGSIFPWWTSMMASIPASISWAYFGAIVAVALTSIAAAMRSRAYALVSWALFGAAAGLLLATLLNLHGLPESGEGGRLVYGPIAWFALAAGVSCAPRQEASRPPRIQFCDLVALCTICVTCALGVTLLHELMENALFAQESNRSLRDAIPAWAETHDGLSLLIVPERLGPFPVARNAQASLVLPPLQTSPLLHRILPTLPVETGMRYEQFKAGLATRLVEQKPRFVDADTLTRLLEPAAARWPDHYACWQVSGQRILEFTAPSRQGAKQWNEDIVRSTDKVCGNA